MRRELLPLLTSIDAFANLGEEDLGALVEACQELHVRPGEVLVSEGAKDDRLFILLRGRTEVYRRRGRGILAELGPGSLIGLLASLLGGERTSSVRATERSQLAVLRGSALELLSLSHAPIGLAVQTAMVAQLLDDVLVVQRRLGDLGA